MITPTAMRGTGASMPSSGAMAGAVAASLLLVATELAGGVTGHSIALISDAVHNLTDVPSLAIAWIAMRVGGASRERRRKHLAITE